MCTNTAVWQVPFAINVYCKWFVTKTVQKQKKTEPRNMNPNFSFVDKDSVDTVYKQFLDKFKPESQSIAEIAFKTLTTADFNAKVTKLAVREEYVGFNPMVTLQTFLERSKLNTARGEFEIQDVEGNPVMKIPKAGKPVIDLSILIIFSIRGPTRKKKILANVSDQWKVVLENKFETYGITNARRGSKLKATDITLGRLAGCVPHFVIYLMNEGQGKMYVNYSLFCSAYNIVYPKCVLTQAFSGMVPQNGVGSDLIKHCYMYAFLYDTIINPERKITDYKAYLQELVSFVHVTHKCNLYSDEYRKSVLKYCNLVDISPEGFFITDLGARVITIGNELWTTIEMSFSYESASAAIAQNLNMKVKAKAQMEYLQTAAATSSTSGQSTPVPTVAETTQVYTVTHSPQQRSYEADIITECFANVIINRNELEWEKLHQLIDEYSNTYGSPPALTLLDTLLQDFNTIAGFDEKFNARFSTIYHSIKSV